MFLREHSRSAVHREPNQTASSTYRDGFDLAHTTPAGGHSAAPQTPKTDRGRFETRYTVIIYIPTASLSLTASRKPAQLLLPSAAAHPWNTPIHGLMGAIARRLFAAVGCRPLNGRTPLARRDNEQLAGRAHLQDTGDNQRQAAHMLSRCSIVRDNGRERRA